MNMDNREHSELSDDDKKLNSTEKGTRPFIAERKPSFDRCRILIRGIHQTVSFDELEEFLGKTFGGDIGYIEYEEGSRKAIVSFENDEGARKALSRKDLDIAGSPLVITKVKPNHYKMNMNKNSERNQNNNDEDDTPKPSNIREEKHQNERQRSEGDDAPSSEDQQTSDKTQHAFAMPYSAVLSKMPNTIRTKEGISITLKKGSLAEEKADVLFNSTRNDLNLASGTLSSALLEEAGPRIQEECYNNKPSIFRPGDIVVTSGGNLQAKSVFHGFCRPWNGVQGKPDLEAIIRNALDEAHDRNYGSIAFPAIGAGNLQYPPDVVSEVIVKEVISFSAKYPKTTLNDVRIILFPGDEAVIKAFEDYWKSITDPKEATGHHIREKGKYYNIDTTLCVIDQVGRTLPQLVEHCIVYENKDETVGQIEGMTITVKQGDITKESTDVIMSSTNSKFNKGNVLRVLMKVGGQQIEDECNELLKTEGPLKDVAMTNSGRLRCKKILHINVLTNDWNDLLLKAFNLVEEKGMRSLAMPAIGTGALGMKASDMSDVILGAVTMFAVTHKPNNFLELVIVLYDRSVFKDFRTQMSSILKRKQSGFFSKILGSLRKAVPHNKPTQKKSNMIHKLSVRPSEMKQRQKKNPSTTASVRGTLLESVGPLPTTWITMNPGDLWSLVQLSSDAEEYEEVAMRFTPGSIKSIQRVQNPTLYQRYLLRQQQMNEANPGLENEKIMYHGTATDSLDNINTSGFNRSYCGKNATKYGDGVYFAVDPMYAASFAHPDSSGNRHVYQARVLVGKSTIGTKGMKEPPHISDSSAKRYDSVTDATRRRVVIFYDEQAYPEYLITFEINDEGE